MNQLQLTLTAVFTQNRTANCEVKPCVFGCLMWHKLKRKTTTTTKKGHCVHFPNFNKLLRQCEVTARLRHTFGDAKFNANNDHVDVLLGHDSSAAFAVESEEAKRSKTKSLHTGASRRRAAGTQPVIPPQRPANMTSHSAERKVARGTLFMTSKSKKGDTTAVVIFAATGG